MRVLLIEDDYNLGLATEEGLRQEFAVDWVKSAEDGEEALLSCDYDLIILDINLPGMSGIEFLKVIRVKNNIPVLLLTALDKTSDKVNGLKIGADDYLSKPFDLDELIARCEAITRRQNLTAKKSNIVIDNLSYNRITNVITKDGKEIILSGKEFSIFKILVDNLNRTVSRESLVNQIYDWSNEDVESNTIEVHVAGIRKKLGKDIIQTKRGLGYIIISK